MPVLLETAVYYNTNRLSSEVLSSIQRIAIMFPLFTSVISVVMICFRISRTIRRVPLYKPSKINRLQISTTVHPSFNFNLCGGKPDGVIEYIQLDIAFFFSFLQFIYTR